MSSSSDVAASASSARRTSWKPAVLLDGIALILLALGVGAAYHGAFFLCVLASFPSALFAVAGTVVTGAFLTDALSGKRKTAAIAGTIVVGLLLLPLGGVVLLAAGDAQPNPAAVAEAPLDQVIERAGGHRLCSGGDPGRGPDNLQPVSYSVYTAPADSGQLRRQLVTTANARDYVVSHDGAYDYQRRATPRLDLDTGLRSIEFISPCGNAGKTPRAAPGQQLIRLAVSYPQLDPNPSQLLTPTTPPER